MTTALKEIQTAMRTAIVAGDFEAADSAVLEASIDGLGLNPRQRVQIHQNNFRETLTDSFAAFFPAVRIFVGPSFFRAAVKHFFAEFPPKKACLSYSGEQFGDFLRQWSHAESIVYVADLADLEYAIERSQNAAALSALDSLQETVIEDQLADIHIQPFAFLLQSNWPVVSFWMAANGMIPPESIDVHSGGQNALVTRVNHAVEVQLLSDETADLFNRLKIKKGPISKDDHKALADLMDRGVLAQTH